MLEAPPLLPTGPVMVSPRWRNPALLAIPALLLVMIAGVALWPRGAGTPVPAPPPVMAAAEPDAGKAGTGETGSIPTKALPLPAVTSLAAAPPTELPAVKPDAVVAKPTAVLGIAVAPWGEVYVNGKKMGVSPPLTELKLAPGKYVVEIRNTTFPAYRETIELVTQNSIRIRHKFQ